VKEYGKILAVRYIYSTNGQKIYEFDLESGTGDYIEKYPSPEELYLRTFGEANNTREILQKEPYYISSKRPRYYQEIAISKVIAFQVAYKLFMARWSRDGIGKRRPRILMLADRNILVDQAMNTFNPLEKDILKINGTEIKKR
jgi:type I restriction enzyme R subunit